MNTPRTQHNNVELVECDRCGTHVTTLYKLDVYWLCRTCYNVVRRRKIKRDGRAYPTVD